MTLRQLTERHLKFLSLLGATHARLSLNLSKCHIVGNYNVVAEIYLHCRVEISAKEGYIRHFRHCPDNYPKHFPLDSELINDNWVAEWSRRIQHNVENVRYHVFGSSKYVIYPKTYA